MRRLKMAILVSHPIQYFVPVYRELAKRDDLDLLVLFRTRVGVEPYFDSGFGQTVQWDIPLIDGYDSSFLSKKLKISGIEWGVIWTLVTLRPDVLLVHGYNQATNILSMLVGKMLGVRILMRGDTRLSRYHSLSGWKSYFKRWLFRLVDGFLTIGINNRNYYKSFGVAEERLYFAPFSVENSAFALGSDRDYIRTTQRRALGVNEGAKVILFASKLILRKRAADAIEAIRLLQESQKDVMLIIAGNGPEERALQHQARDLEHCVKFVGFKNQTEMPGMFALADVFVLPSVDEPWGLIVNEAMAAGLPVVVSDDVGAAADLVQGQATGLIHTARDVADLAQALEKLVGDDALRLEMGRNATRFIAGWDSCAAAERIAMAAHAVIDGVD